MTNTNGFSDSQESALLCDEEYHELVREIGYNNLPLITEDIIEESCEAKYSDTLTQTYEHEGRIRDGHGHGHHELRDPFFQEMEAPIPVPINEEFPGDLNFQFSLVNQGAKNYVYSQALKKVFINMEATLPLRFKWEPALDGLFLRTTMVFSLEQYRSDPVKRCHNHMVSTIKSNQLIDPRIIKHVVRCQDRSSMYEEFNEHLSILTPLHTPQPGSQYVSKSFQFLCKNSCTSGMNRRPTELIFTLENCMKKVLGRRRLLVRVCSCPKRDKEKEETENMEAAPSVKKRKLNNDAQPTPKKMLSSCDTHVFNVQLNIVGKENYLAVMKYAYDIMAGQAAKTGQFEFFKPYMDDILRKTP